MILNKNRCRAEGAREAAQMGAPNILNPALLLFPKVLELCVTNAA